MGDKHGYQPQIALPRDQRTPPGAKPEDHSVTETVTALRARIEALESELASDRAKLADVVRLQGNAPSEALRLRALRRADWAAGARWARDFTAQEVRS